MPMLMNLGIGLFFAGVLGTMALLFTNGGAEKSRQFVVLAALWNGSLGAHKRLLCRTALLALATGALLTFAGVSQMDAERAGRCHDYCVGAGFVDGKIGPSVERSKEARFVACVCTAPDKAPLELRADSISK